MTNYYLTFRKCTRPKWARVLRAIFLSEMHYTGSEAMELWPKVKLEPDTLYEISIKL